MRNVSYMTLYIWNSFLNGDKNLEFLWHLRNGMGEIIHIFVSLISQNFNFIHIYPLHVTYRYSSIWNY